MSRARQSAEDQDWDPIDLDRFAIDSEYRREVKLRSRPVEPGDAPALTATDRGKSSRTRKD